ncbi:RHS repeat-associated core domain protein [Citrobacter youngae ATCC 29220]|uniref:RHS repeat-associated core domain protein n=1 Tax=Citrobacter youngae ATCC 29220 TaxID=500640 RepID=D4BEF8_9ENTR|nr:RHS repeat-associated core domain protein [Citrobacter youngae ATCC 29220]
MLNQLAPVYTPRRKFHLYHCDHRGLPLALINQDGAISWRAEYDEWGNVLREDNPHNLQRLIRLPGQQCDEESGLYYNRHRYDSPGQDRYLTLDPIGLEGGLNPYTYPRNPIRKIDPLGLQPWNSINMGSATTERASLGLWMAQNGASTDQMVKALAPLPPPSSISRECRVSGIAALGSGLSGSYSYNEKNGGNVLIGAPLAAIGLRGSLTCGLKFRSSDAKDLKTNAGFAIGLGFVSIEVTQTTKWPEVYIGSGTGIGPELKAPYTSSVSIPVY